MDRGETLRRLAESRRRRTDPQTGRPRFDLTGQEARSSARTAMNLAGAVPAEGVWECPVHGQIPASQVSVSNEIGQLGTHGVCSALVVRQDGPRHTHDKPGLYPDCPACGTRNDP